MGGEGGQVGALEAIGLRPASSRDARCIFEAWGRFPQNFERLTAAPFRDLRDAQAYLDRLFDRPGSRALHITQAGRVVGLVKAVVSEHRAQIGYVVHQAHWGRGLASAAVAQLVGRLSAEAAIQRIWATCALDNPASIRVLEKCGFVREGVLRNWVVYPALGPQAVDNYSYAWAPRTLLASEGSR